MSIPRFISEAQRAPAGNTPEPFVYADDVADVAVAALTEDGHAGHVYELTGPRLLMFADAVGEIARAARREIGYVSVSVEDFVASLTRGGAGRVTTWIEAHSNAAGRAASRRRSTSGPRRARLASHVPARRR